MNYSGVIIEESLEDKAVLRELTISKTEVEKVTAEHKTPWVKQWTLHSFEVPEDRADTVAEKIAKSLDAAKKHAWYADFKNSQFHYIIFRDKVFKIDRSNNAQYQDAVTFGKSLGIPDYQLDFSPAIKEWLRSSQE